jgi:phosphoserine phosphatase RsbU/P
MMRRDVTEKPPRPSLNERQREMVANSPRILLIADTVPSDIPSLSALLARSDMRFVVVPMLAAAAKVQSSDITAAVILATPPYLNGHQRDLIHVIDALAQNDIGAVVVTFNAEDQLAAGRMSSAEGLMTVSHACSAEELAGRVAGLAALRPIIEQLHRENSMLRRFDNGLNNQITQIDEEMRLAARLQVDFLPRTLPESRNCSFSVLFRPASYVSGDIYDACRLDEDHIAFFIADAVGHGMPAALLTIFIKRALKTKEISDNAYRIIPPDEALEHLNKELVGQQLTMCQFVTMAYFILNTKTLTLQYARAGHPLPMLLRTDGSVTELEADGALLGVFPEEHFPLATIQLVPGDSVLVYSDGFESAFADATGIINERYRQEFSKLACANPHERFNAMVQLLDQQEGSLHQRDDLTALLLHVRPDPAN